MLASGAATALTLFVFIIFNKQIKNQFEENKNKKSALLTLGAQLLIGAALPKLLDRRMNAVQICGLTALSFLSALFYSVIMISFHDDTPLIKVLIDTGTMYLDGLKWLVGMKG